MYMLRFIAPVALGISALAATPASAAMVLNPNGTVTVTGASGGSAVINLGGNVEGANVPGLTSQLTLTFVQALAGTYTFDYTLANTSSNPTTTSRITAFGFNTNPNITPGGAAIVTGTVFDEIRYNTNVPNGVGDIELCFTTNNCAGGGGEGLTVGQSGSGRFTLNFGNANLATLILSDTVVRYQAITAPGIREGSGTGQIVTPVPEPGTWAMMLLGFGAVGFSIRRRRRSGTALLPQMA